ncbi:hypothetical protein E5288_WYG015337 [Bos mutus]|uniref:Uncharacterized protein n=1 Tax=Bos mutus TaxID=72004 RepID=A0A6B0REW5_9CETA|nr:hypothetical protein [Bos mutus]
MRDRIRSIKHIMQIESIFHYKCLETQYALFRDFPGGPVADSKMFLAPVPKIFGVEPYPCRYEFPLGTFPEVFHRPGAFTPSQGWFCQPCSPLSGVPDNLHLRFNPAASELEGKLYLKLRVFYFGVKNIELPKPLMSITICGIQQLKSSEFSE